MTLLAPIATLIKLKIALIIRAKIGEIFCSVESKTAKSKRSVQPKD